MKSFYDPIYGQIHLDEWELKLLNIPELSKYRFIRMAGFLYTTFHSSNHTRFESIIGTLHLCELLRNYYEKNEVLRKKYRDKYLVNFEDINDYFWFLLKLSLILRNLQHFCFSQPFLDAIERLDPKSRNIFFTKGSNAQTHLNGAIENFLKKKDVQDIINECLNKLGKNYDINKLKEHLIEVFNKSSEILISPLVENVLPLSRLDYYARDSYYSNGLITYNAKKILNGFIGISKNKTNSKSRFNLIFKIDIKSELEKFYYQRIYMYINYYSNPNIRKYESVFENLIKHIIENYEKCKKLLEKKSNSRSGIDDFFLMFIIEEIKEKSSKSDQSLQKLINYRKFKSLFKEPLRLSAFIERDGWHHLLKKKEVYELVDMIYDLLKDKTIISSIEMELIKKLNEFCSNNSIELKFENYDILLDVNAPRRRKSAFENIKFIELKKLIESNDVRLIESEREKNLINFEELDQISNQFYVDYELKLDMINVYYYEEMNKVIKIIESELIKILPKILVKHLFSNGGKSEEIEDKKKKIQNALSHVMKELVKIDKEESNIIYDPVYGIIELFPWEMELLEISEIKKLKWIRQQSLINFSFPGAVHTRFEHSLGTLYIGDKIFKRLSQKNQKLQDAKNLHFLLRLSCLFHDIGHGPFSHLTEKLIRRNFESYEFEFLKETKKYSHEAMGEDILRSLSFQTCLKQIFEKNEEELIKLGFIDKNITSDFITDLCIKMGAIITNRDEKGDSGIELLKVLLCGGIDADRIDYLIRDSHYTGVGWGSVNIDNIIEYMGCKKIYGNDENYTLFLDEIDGLIAIETLLYLRNLEASKIFNEKYGRLCEKLIINTIESKDKNYVKSINDNIAKMNDYMLFKDFFDFNNICYSVLIDKLYNENIFEYYIYEIKLTDLRYNWRRKVESSKSEFKIKKLEDELKDYLLKARTEFSNRYCNPLSDDDEKKKIETFSKNLNKDYLLISIPKIPRQKTENILIKINKDYYSLEDVSPLTEAYKKSYRTFWTLNVYYCQKLDRKIKKFINTFLDSSLKS